jgi:hypothetical protein
VILGTRFLYYFAQGDRAGHIQSLILAAVFLITGFHTLLMALLADLIAVNRRLSEDVLIRLKRMEMPAAAQQQRPRNRERGEKPIRRERQLPAGAPPPAAAADPQTQWVWLLDEDKLQSRDVTPPPPAQPPGDDEPTQPDRGGPRRRRRRRGGMRQHPELPGNRGKHLAGEGD